jgi:hypothetical protein
MAAHVITAPRSNLAMLESPRKRYELPLCVLIVRKASVVCSASALRSYLQDDGDPE